jgi:hypothetical protein
MENLQQDPVKSMMLWYSMSTTDNNFDYVCFSIATVTPQLSAGKHHSNANLSVGYASITKYSNVSRACNVWISLFH